ncbi:hypothetical protein AOLI_G00191090 [Acnodon oligacanthus]
MALKLFWQPQLQVSFLQKQQNFFTVYQMTENTLICASPCTVPPHHQQMAQFYTVPPHRQQMAQFYTVPHHQQMAQFCTVPLHLQQQQAQTKSSCEESSSARG